jgi:hypothetical protein
MAKKRHKEDTEFMVAAKDSHCVPGYTAISLPLENSGHRDC